jgi:zinc D-Ala-D-Ala dipeptidase
MRFIFFIIFVAVISSFAQDYALDDAHNHDGTHVEGQTDCGSNYMQPGEIARLGSHSFLILGEDGPNHLLIDHRSGTPPHTYQFILRLRVDANEIMTYHKLLKETKIALPAVTTIYFDKTGKQVDRTFFCLTDLKKIFGPEQKPNDAYSKLFPIRASWQKDADFEGAFPIKETVVAEDPLIIERKDVEIIVYRYLPSYLEQSSFRKLLKSRGSPFTSILSHAPIRADESSETASQRASYIKSGAFDSNGETCPSDYYLKTVRPPKTKHGFLLLAESSRNSVLAAHLYDQSPQNYQTTLHFELTDEQMKIFRSARQESQTPLLFMPSQYFCMSEIKDLLKRKVLNLKGTIYKNSTYEEFRLGEPVGELELASGKIKVLVNRILQSLMNPQSVARDVFGIVDIKTINPDILVEAAYWTDWNFVGKPIDGYFANRCYLTTKAAKALSEVQKDVAKQGYSLLVFDCYRPQRAVNHFVRWTKDATDTKMQSIFYADEPKKDLIKNGYIASNSGHSRASTVDLTLVRTNKFQSKHFAAKAKIINDCRKSQKNEDMGQVDMGTAYDCFSKLANTANLAVSESSQKNRQILKLAMEKHGFINYPKEWWHFSLNDEPYPKDYFDFEIQ